MQLIAYIVLYDKYFDLRRVILTQIGSKLGNKESRINKIYFSRFIMITINHLVREMVLDKVDDKLNCWTQSKRVFMDLVRINRNSGLGFTFSPLVQVYISTLSSSVSPTSLPSIAMEGANQHPPAQAAKPSKNKSKQTTSLISQNDWCCKNNF